MKPDPAMQRLAQATAATQGRNPSVVLEAFVPQTDLVVDLLSLIRLERIGSPLIKGRTPEISDLLIAYGVLTDWPTIEKAWRKNSLDKWVETFASDFPLSGLPALAQQVADAISAATAPADTSTALPDEKKSPQESAGGSTSQPTSADTTAGPPTSS
jgi:hypothetical protein